MSGVTTIDLKVRITERVPLEPNGNPPCRVVIGAAIGDMFEVGEINHPVGHPPPTDVIANEHAKLVGRLVGRYLQAGR